MQTIVTCAGTNGLGAMPGKKGAATIKKKPSPTDVAKIWAKGANVGDAALNIFGVKGYVDLFKSWGDVPNFQDSVWRAMNSKWKAISEIVIYSRCCPEGICRNVFSYNRYLYYMTRAKSIINEFNVVAYKFLETEDKMMLAAVQKAVWDGVFLCTTKAVANGIKAGYKATKIFVTGMDETIAETNNFVKAFDDAAVNTLLLEKDGFIAGIDKFINYDFNYIYEEYDDELKRVGSSSRESAEKSS